MPNFTSSELPLKKGRESRPGGGKAQSLRWALVTSNAWVLGTLREGYCLEFLEQPPLQHRIRITQRVGPEIQVEVQSFLAKRAIEAVPQGQEVGGFY